jgi:cytochrome c oxidase subunit II
MHSRLVPIFLSLVLLTGSVRVQSAALAAKPRHIEITARRFAYEPDAITLKKGESVVLVLKSADVKHGLRIHELGLDLKASQGKPDEVLFTPQKVGAFVGHCSVFCGAKHGSMTITFHVVE